MFSLENPILRLARIINYPELPAATADVFTFVIDNRETKAIVMGDGRVMFRYVLCYMQDVTVEHSGFLGKLSSIAMGRSLCEDAILSYDPDDASLFLWQSFEPPASDSGFIALLEGFIASYEWWAKRCEELREPGPVFPSIMIRP